MKKRLLLYGSAAILLLTVLIAMDRYKLYKEEKPPLPIVTIEGEEIPVVMGTYHWRGTRKTAEEPIKLLAGLNATKARERQRLKVIFPADRNPSAITITQVNSVPGGEKLAAEGDTILVPKSQTLQNLHFQITAGWDKEYKSFSTYYVKLMVEDLPHFYDFLSKDPEKLSVLAIVPRGESEKYDIPEEIKAQLDSFHMSDDLEGLKKKYPELTSDTIPVYMIFDTGELQSTYLDKEGLILRLTDDGRD
ncbi:hypothetical protein [Mesobacillus subterraneus]|uniref:Uncharacterized protein n=1 Tax=Mesobacillus subterraneus TaxID=285983 RepID=A0A3R9EAE8_9BACI|nr:hypothetical protein [Mesobacillus subterraneus]RSD29591.1 hypothetical protein EJA10_00330 [Mesobacillus subterraneus]